MPLLVLASALVLLLGELAARFRALDARGRAGRLVALTALVAAIVWLRPEMPVLEKVLGRLAMPAGLLFVSGWVVGLLRLRRDPRAGALVLGACALYAAIGNEYLGAALMDRLEVPFRGVVPLAERPFDVVFVLGGGVAPTPHVELPGGGEPSDEMEGQLGASGDRVALAARMYHAGIAPLLVASGRSVPGIGAHWESGPVTAGIWRSLGVPEEAILVVEGDHNTSAEVRTYARLARERGFSRVGLLSSAWHLRRVMRLAAREGLEAAPLPADFHGEPAYHGLLTLLPTGYGFAEVHRASWEWLGAALGR